MRKDILEMLWRVERMRKMINQIDEALAELDWEERLVLDILLQQYDEKIVRICDELQVSEPTAYRAINRLLHKISELFEEKGVIKL